MNLNVHAVAVVFTYHLTLKKAQAQLSLLGKHCHPVAALMRHKATRSYTLQTFCMATIKHTKQTQTWVQFHRPKRSLGNKLGVQCNLEGKKSQWPRQINFNIFFLLMGKVVSGSYFKYLVCQGPWGTAVYGGVTLKPHKTQAAEQIIKQRTRKKEQADSLFPCAGFAHGNSILSNHSTSSLTTFSYESP